MLSACVCVEFRHLTRNSFRYRRKVGEGNVLMRTDILTPGSKVHSAYPAMSGNQREPIKKKLG